MAAAEESAPAVRRVRPEDAVEWLRMRQLLWPDETEDEARRSMAEMLSDPMRPVWVVVRPEGGLGGFVEAGLRGYAEGCGPGPVTYLEGWFVDADLRRRGVGRALVTAVEAWGRSQGCTEIASDTWLDNTVGIDAHAALGFDEVERLVAFRKAL